MSRRVDGPAARIWGTNMNDKLKGKKIKKVIFGVVGVLALLVVAFMLFPHVGSGKDDSETIYTTVQEGPLVINITESGSVKPREQLIIKSEVEGRHAILSLIPEGTRVQKGQVLVELDTSDMDTRRTEMDIVVQNADSAYITAKENLDVVMNQSMSDVELAELKVIFAKEDLQKYIEGEYPNLLNEAIGIVTLAEEELERAREKHEWSKKLFEEKYLSETELKSDELSWKSAELSLKTAKGNLGLLERYTYKRQVAQLESDFRQNTMALERARKKANSDVVQAQVALRAKEIEFNSQKERLAKNAEQIIKARITAPMDGLVIYASSAQNHWGNQEPLAEGQEIRERQELIYLPTADTFQAEVNVHESNLKKVYPGLPVRVRVDAVPGRMFMGVVEKISPLPDGQKMWSNPDLKVYKTQINIDGGGDVLKSGMNCQAEIIVEQHDKTLYLPIQCITRVDKVPSVWIQTAAGPAVRAVEIGQDNNRFVRIISGVSVGDKVMLTPPLSTSVSGHATDVLEDIVIPSHEEYLQKAEGERLGVLEREAVKQSSTDREGPGPKGRKPQTASAAEKTPPGAVIAEARPTTVESK